jgi:hypothetical protein
MTKTNEQLRRIFGLAKSRGFDKEDLEALAFEISDGRIARLSLLSFDEANALIRRLGGDEISSIPRRTLRYRRRQAGIPQIATTRQLALMRSLAVGQQGPQRPTTERPIMTRF